MYKVNMKLRIFFMIGIALFAGLASCSTAPITAASTTPLNDRAYADLGMAAGYDLTFSVFGLWMIGSPDAEKAIRQALEQKGGDALLNVTLSQQTIWLLLFSIDILTVDGEAVKFHVEEGVPENDIKTE